MLTVDSFSFLRFVAQWRAVFLTFIIACVVLTAPVSAGTDQMTQQVIMLLQSGNYAAALEKLGKLEEAVLNPGNLDKLWSTAYLGLGYQLLAEGDFADARLQFQAGRQHREADPRLWAGEAMAWFKEGRFAESSYLLDQAIGYAPADADLYYLLGRSTYAQGRMPEAIDALTSSLELAEKQEVLAFYQKVNKEWQVEQRMDQDSRGVFKLSFVDGEGASSMASDILAVLEGAYVELGSLLDFYPQVTIPVLLYTRDEYRNLTGSPDWSGALYDGKIRLPLAGVSGGDERFATLLYHEYMHVLVHYLGDHQAPVWLNEGLAEVAGRTVHAYDPDEPVKPLRRDDLLDWQALSRPFFGLEKNKVMTAYQQSHSIVNFMVNHYGWHKIAELLEGLANRSPWQQAVSSVYTDFGMDWPAIQSEWQALALKD